MKFTKMEGLGNDYIYINGFEEKIDHKSELALKLSDRHFGIGGDGVIFINPSEIADFEMEMYNADGSRSEMCGNGIRCVAKYVYDNKMTDKKELTIESFGKIKFIELTVKNQQVEMVRVNMGAPELEASLIPVESNQLRVIDEDIIVGDKTYKMTCVSMGNPHAVIFVDDVKNLEIGEIGPLFEHHCRFPKRTNTEFVKVLDRSTVEMRVWERGTGETLACGTGSCATAVASILNGLTDNKVTVKLLGGDLFIEWDREINRIFMTGPAKTVFEGEINLKNFF